MSMRVEMLALVGAGLFVAAPAAAQVHAQVQIGVPGVVLQPVVVARPFTRVLWVERGPLKHPRWYARRGWQPVTVWFDGHRFLHPASTWRPWYQEVVVYQRDGRFLLADARPGRYDRWTTRTWTEGGGSYQPDRRDGRWEREWDD